MATVSSRFLGMPRTMLGWWSVGVTLLFTLLFVAITSEWFHFPGFLTMALGFVAGIVTLIALIWKGERSWLVWLMLIPGLFAILFSLSEIFYPH